MDYLSNLEGDINEICNDCHHKRTERCNYRRCNIGFTKYVVNNQYFELNLFTHIQASFSSLVQA